MKTKEYGYIAYYAQIGLGVSYNLKAKADNVAMATTSTPSVPVPENETDKDVTGDKINMFRGSFIVSGGIEYSLRGNTKLLAGITFNNGLTNILKGKPNKGINNFIGLNLGIIF